MDVDANTDDGNGKEFNGAGAEFYIYTDIRTGRTKFYKEILSEEEMKKLHLKRY